MKLWELLLILVLLAALATGAYILWLNFPTESQNFEEFHAEVSQDLPLRSAQFYNNMRYTDKIITYEISQTCSKEKQRGVEEAFKILGEKTILEFTKKPNTADIKIACSNIAPEPEQENHFVAGEGGPSTIINTTLYAVIIKGEIALYRDETCNKPQTAIHEILHALGFDHNADQKSIMYPITSCDQEIDQYIINEINRLYSQTPSADLIIESATANKSGRYLNFEVTITNVGLIDIQDSNLLLLANGAVIKEFELKDIDIGAKRHLSVTNLRIPRSTEQITLTAQTQEPEISKQNNQAIISIVQ